MKSFGKPGFFMPEEHRWTDRDVPRKPRLEGGSKRHTMK
jgi:hypothetical protein